MSEWRPIETAPKDGREILVTDYRIMEWTHVVFFDDEASPPHVWGRADTDTHWHHDMFTHWMPVPKAPPLTSHDGETP